MLSFPLNLKIASTTIQLFALGFGNLTKGKHILVCVGLIDVSEAENGQSYSEEDDEVIAINLRQHSY